MIRDELVGVLRQPYSNERGFGTEKIAKTGYENICFVVPPKPPHTISEKLSLPLVREANLALQRRPTLQSASGIQQSIAYLLVRREAVSSSRMEGTWSTVDDVLSPSIDEAGLSATASVRGYANALMHGIQSVQSDGMTALTPELLCTLHKKVMQKDPGFRGISGRLRTPGLLGDVVLIGSFGRKEDSTYNPAPPTRVARCLNDVLQWMCDESILQHGDAGMGMVLPVRMAIGHAHFEAVHPFSDGNGRVGRMLWAFQMAATGRLPLYLSSYVEAEKSEYGAALQEAQKQLSYRRLIDFVCRAIVACSEEEAVTQQVLEHLPDVWQERGKFRGGSSAARALELLIKMPVVNVKLLAFELKVSTQAASQGLQRLEKAGVVRDRSGRGRGRVFVAEEVIGVLARPFGMDTDAALEGARNVLTTSTSVIQ
jgi:Fic family protein